MKDNLYRGIALTDHEGNIVEAYDMDAYGNTLTFTVAGTGGNWWADDATQSDQIGNRIIYCGYMYDPETRLYYVRNRHYNPQLGRWVQRDPIGYDGGVNLYVYVANSPISLCDPLGLDAGYGSAISNTFSWAVGHSGDTNYGPDSPESLQMSQSTVGESLVNFFLNKNKNKRCVDWIGVTDFVGKYGVSGAFENLTNGTAEFVGSAGGDVIIDNINTLFRVNGNCTVSANFKLTNTTSLRSLLYGVYPNSWNVTTPGKPLSNWTQTYEWEETFNCKCCDSN
jgi:RHS repeat-associated protein